VRAALARLNDALAALDAALGSTADDAAAGERCADALARVA
jgi:hypothetical protein